MRITHRLQVRATCPVDGKRDEYSVRVDVTEVVPVEAILDTVRLFTREPIFQEDLTRAIHLKTGGRVTSRGVHSGVRTTVVCE